MNNFLIKHLVALAFLFSMTISAWSFDITEPIIYPHKKEITSNSPSFIWQDFYLDRKTRKSHQFRLTISSNKNNKNFVKIFNPLKLYDSFYSYQLPDTLPDGKYFYTIEHLKNGKPTKKRKYTGYLHYPINGFFKINTKNVNNKNFDFLSAEKKVEYMFLNHINKLENKYNSIFFAGASVGSFGLGLLFYKVLTFGTVSKIIAYICFASAISGVPLSTYYGYKYFKTKNDLQKIIEVGSISLDYKITNNNIKTAISYKY